MMEDLCQDKRRGTYTIGAITKVGVVREVEYLVGATGAPRILPSGTFCQAWGTLGTRLWDIQQ